jgi:hypothetical protein
MLCSALAMLLRWKVVAYVGLCLHLSSFSQMKLADRDVKVFILDFFIVCFLSHGSLQNILTNLSVSLLSLFSIYSASLVPPPPPAS